MQASVRARWESRNLRLGSRILWLVAARRRRPQHDPADRVFSIGGRVGSARTRRGVAMTADTARPVRPLAMNEEAGARL